MTSASAAAVDDRVGIARRVHDSIATAITRRADKVVALSHGINELAELGFQEHRSVALIADLLRSEGHQIEVGAYGLPTAFKAVAGSGSPRVVVLAEYDALPDIGHGCGHNVIAAVAVGTFLAVAEQIEKTGGSVVLLGSPAEENGSGKELLARAGAFEDVDAAVMIHPGSGDDLANMTSLGSRGVLVKYRGKPAHASASPEDGRNALDAMVAAYQGIAALRQHIPRTDRLHTIITEGGSAVNVIPETAGGVVMLRSATFDGLIELTARVQDILDAAALMSGTTLEAGWDPIPPYLPIRSNHRLAQQYTAHSIGLGRRFVSAEAAAAVPPGSTDMGNVSLRVPSIHPMVGISPPDVSLHTEQFAAHATCPQADTAVVEATIALASTVADFLLDEELRQAVQDEFTLAGGPVDVETVLSVAAGQAQNNA